MKDRNAEGYPDPTAARAIKAADRPPEEIIMFRKMIKALSVICHVRVLGKVTLVDKKGGGGDDDQGGETADGTGVRQQDYIPVHAGADRSHEASGGSGCQGKNERGDREGD